MSTLRFFIEKYIESIMTPASDKKPLVPSQSWSIHGFNEEESSTQTTERDWYGDLDEPVACVHDVSYPEGYVPRPPNPSSTQEDSKPAK
ncbi:hypothetical protein F0562_020207 [Nyssa sinensis]|uniref:Uncharacterized protein n=1 Tax=Nyssa sinensis TaxID=561372 RepID=A0A5J5BQH6_9ASTE|nr:hypothetical protein F0562_020207 [Nyssa sinensis]